MSVRNVRKDDNYPKLRAILAIVQDIEDLKTGEKQNEFGENELVMIPRICFKEGERLMIHSMKGSGHHLSRPEVIVHISETDGYITITTPTRSFLLRKKMG